MKSSAFYAVEIASFCADDWGDPSDPYRVNFLAGFADSVARGGRGPTAPTTLAASAAYNSGFIAAQKEFDL